MKKNSPRRSIVDAIDFMTDDSFEQQIIDITIDEISEFTEHPFHLYEGKRLNDMVESIKKSGVLIPVIVRKKSDKGYEMLAGHNRMSASKIAGNKTVPAIIKENLTDEEAYIYVIETNLMQRSFNDMYPSEKSIVLELRYSKEINQGKRTDIMNELKSLEAGESIEEQVILDSRGRIAKEYGLSGRSIARLLRINKLTTKWKLAVDNGGIAILTGVEISYLNKKLQDYLYNECAEMKVKLSLKDAKELKILKTKNDITKYLIKKEKGKVKEKNYQSIKIPNDIVKKYFDKKVKNKEIQSIIEMALDNYFENKDRSK
jgi:ParB family chromosome partitioning protein